MTTSIPRATGFPIVASLLCSLVSGCGIAQLDNERAIGRPCDLSVPASTSQATYNASAKECPGLCLQPATSPMSTDEPSTGPTCSGECSQDSDCAGELRDPNNPTDTRCQGGFACAVPFVVGPLCCKKLCVCRDFLTKTESGPPLGCTESANSGTCPGVGNSPVATNLTGAGAMTDLYLGIRPRKLDIVMAVANSPTMGPKVAKLQAAFPKLIDTLRDPSTGWLPDLHVAIIDSDLGTGGAHASGACGPKTLADGTSSIYGDMGRFQMRSAPAACNFAPGARFLEIASGYTSDISRELSCLTGNLGTAGCGQVHPLQAVEFALAAPGIGNDVQRNGFLRPEAFLGLIFLADQDDCSAAPNDGMFIDKPELRGESSRLRCATRAHMCGGTNLTTSPPGYPTRASYTHALSDCKARTDACPNSMSMSGSTDTSVPTDCSPLRGVKEMADAILALKDDPDRVSVAGIFGWPITDADRASASYKIAPIPNPNTADAANPTIFDSWPVCYDPNHMPSPKTTDPTTGFDAEAAAWGASGGLRESAFVDQFRQNGLKFSICQPDFSKAMESFGRSISPPISSFYTFGKPVDTDPATPGVQANCRMAYATAKTKGDKDDGIVVGWTEPSGSIPQCAPGATSDTVAAECWRLADDPNMNLSPTNFRILIVRPAAEIATSPQPPPGTRLHVQCQICPAVAAGASATPGCDY